MWNPFRKSNYRKGHDDGRLGIRDAALYESSPEYKRGWDEGFAAARAKAAADKASRPQRRDAGDGDSEPSPIALMEMGILDPDGKQGKKG
jgi:hypothetical protein